MPILHLFRHFRFKIHLRNSFLQSFQIRSFQSISHNALQNLKKPKSPTDSFRVFRRFLSSDSSSVPSVSKAFDELSHRNSFSQVSRFINVICFLRSSMTIADVGTVINAHCLGLKIGLLANLGNSTSLITSYSKAGDLASSLALFDETHVKDVIVWNAMITALTQNLGFADAIEVFLDMVEQGFGFDSTTLLLVVTAFTNMNLLKQGRSVHGLGIKSGMNSDSSLCNALVNLYAKCHDFVPAECIFLGIKFKDQVSWNTIITGCLANNYPEKSLGYFKWMTCSGEEANNVTLPCVISASGNLENFSLGNSYHGFAIKLGYTEENCISVANSLISMYSQCGHIVAAGTVFHKIVYKDIVSWNAMIDGLASNEFTMEAFDLLSEMQIEGSTQPDTATLVSMIPLCAELCLLREGRAFHGYTTRRHAGRNVLAMNSLIDMYSKCNAVNKAELVFNTIPERDLVSWNTLISGYSQNGHQKEAKALFKSMLFCISEFSSATVLAILPACDSSESLAFGMSIHCWQLKLGFENNIVATNCLMNMYTSCGDLSSALLLFHKMSVARDVASWNTIIYGCASKGHYWEALKAFNSMRREERNLNHDSVTLIGVILACGNLGLIKGGACVHGLALKTMNESETQVKNSLITMYGRFGDTEKARLVFDLIVNRNLRSWNCMISALSQNKAGREAFELFGNLECDPDEVTIASLLSASTQFGFSSYGAQIHSYLIRREFQENPFVASALVGMYSSSGRLADSFKAFNHSKVKSVSAWNTMISAFGFHGNAEHALKLFDDMCKLGINPNKSTFTSLLTACGHSGLVDEALWYYSQMFEKYGVEPITEHRVCIVVLLGRCGKLNEAYEFVRRVSGLAEPGVWGALLSACSRQGDAKMGKEVGEVLFELEPENSGYYIALANMYSAAGRWKDAVELRQIVEDKRLKKPAGLSVVDVRYG